jgi:hypothetical protein
MGHKNLQSQRSHVKFENETSLQANACQGNQINMDTPEPQNLIDDMDLVAHQEQVRSQNPNNSTLIGIMQAEFANDQTESRGKMKSSHTQGVQKRNPMGHLEVHPSDLDYMDPASPVAYLSHLKQGQEFMQGNEDEDEVRIQIVEESQRRGG